MSEHITAWGDWARKQATTPDGLIRLIVVAVLAFIGWGWYQDSEQDRQLKAEYFRTQIAATAELTEATRQLMDSAVARDIFQAQVANEHLRAEQQIKDNGERVAELQQTTLRLVDQIDSTNKLLAVVVTLLESSGKKRTHATGPWRDVIETLEQLRIPDSDDWLERYERQKNMQGWK